MASMKKSPNTAASTQDLGDTSPQPRIASGTLPPQAAHAPEFVPGEECQPSVSKNHTDNKKGDRKVADASSEKEEAAEKNKRKKKKTKERTKAETEAEEKAEKQQAMDEEWWSDDEIFVRDLQETRRIFGAMSKA